MNLIKKNQNAFIPSLMEELLRPDFFGGAQSFSNSIPAVNIKETEKDFVIEVAAPGFNKDNFNVELDNNLLSISSEIKHKSEEANDKEKYTRKEFSYASFKRSFTLPETVNAESIEANYENGLLVLTLPKKQEALPKPKRLIEIA
jgi:HSP20 family protein